jgi:DeoR/GlpR family transcriptional regulator of sugar metabolism
VVFANFPHNVNILVAEIIKDGDSIMLDTGSTTAYVARALSEQRNLSVVTNCTEIAQARKTIVVADHTKYASQNFVKVCNFDAVDIVVSDRPPPADIMSKLVEAGVKVITPETR